MTTIEEMVDERAFGLSPNDYKEPGSRELARTLVAEIRTDLIRVAVKKALQMLNHDPGLDLRCEGAVRIATDVIVSCVDSAINSNLWR